MKVLFLNCYNGCLDPKRYERLTQFIKRQKPDILGMAELNDWDNKKAQRLEDFLKKTGFLYYTFCKSKSGFNLGIFSKFPIKSEIVLQKGFRTGAVISEIQTPHTTLNVCLTHLHYKNELLRLKEIKLLLPLIINKNNLIFMGDFNSLSPTDAYNNKEILKQIQKQHISKFGTEKLHTSVISYIIKNNLIDTIKLFSKGVQYTVPTLLNNDADHFMRLRVDYIFVSNNLSSKLKKAKTIRNKITNLISDHFPISITLD
jgi:exodeoxyribonuclease III